MKNNKDETSFRRKMHLVEPMVMPKNALGIESHKLDTVAAIWILASNDERAEISYRGLRHRLRLPEDVDERELVAQRAELFRLGIPKERLGQLRERLRQGKSVPSWLRELPEPDRSAAIEQLNENDYFRSQFRAEQDALRSPIEVVDWGLKHIDRLRSAISEKKESQLKQWTGKWIPLTSTLLAVIALVTSTYMQVHTSSDQRALKEYELAFRPKVDGYTRLMQAIAKSLETATTAGDPRLSSALNDLEMAEIELEPFLKANNRAKLKDEVQQLTEFCLTVRRPNSTSAPLSEQQMNTFLTRRNGLRDLLFAALFE